MRVPAAVAWAPGEPFELTEVELDEPRADEVLVRVVASGICHTDANARDARMPVRLPMVLGHEGAGVVERVGSSVSTVHEGDRVLMLPDCCRRCRRCLAGQSKYCLNTMALNFGGRRPDGSPRAHRDGVEVGAAFFGQSSFASHSLATERNLLVVADDAPLEYLAALTCGIQTGAGSVLHSIPVHVGSSLVVFGSGAVGLAAVMAAAAAGASEIIVVDRVAHRLELAAQLGATDTIDTNTIDTNTIDTDTGADLVAEIRARLPEGCDVALDTTGAPSLVRAGVESLAVLGSCGVLTTVGGDLTLPPGALVPGGRSVRGIHGGDAPSPLLVAELIELNRRGLFPYERLVRHYPFEKLNTALADSLDGTTVKPVLILGS